MEIKCNECGSSQVARAGWGWRRNRNSGQPKRVRIQRYICKQCGKIFVLPDRKEK